MQQSEVRSLLIAVGEQLDVAVAAMQAFLHACKSALFSFQLGALLQSQGSTVHFQASQHFLCFLFQRHSASSYPDHALLSQRVG